MSEHGRLHVGGRPGVASTVSSEQLRSALAGRAFVLDSALHRGGPPWGQRAVLAGLTAVCLAVLVAVLATALLANVGRVVHEGGGKTVIRAGSVSDAPGPPVSPGQPARRTQPRAVALQPADLPAGAVISREGPAAFSSSAPPPPSWDVVMRPDPTQPADYEFAESLAVVYSNERVATSAMASLGAAERSAGATEQVATVPIGDVQTVWVEQAPNRPGATIVRVTWRSMNVVGEVSLMTQAGPAPLQRTIQLALLEQERIAAPTPYEEPAG